MEFYHGLGVERVILGTAALNREALRGFMEGFWLRARGSFLTDNETSRNGTDFRVIVRYDFPVI